MPPTTEIILKEGKFWRRDTTERSLGNQDTLIASLAEDVPTMLKNVFMLGDSPVHILSCKGSMVMITAVKKLPFKTWWMLQEDLTLRPVWLQSRGAVEINEPWIVPSILSVLFVLKFNRTESINSALVVDTPYLFAYMDGELRHLYYPNVFTDGRICMGREWDANRTVNSDAMGNFIHAQTTFFSTAMNQDLVKTNTLNIFRRDVSKWIMPSREDYSSNCPIIGPSFMQGFKL